VFKTFTGACSSYKLVPKCKSTTYLVLKEVAMCFNSTGLKLQSVLKPQRVKTGCAGLKERVHRPPRWACPKDFQG
jgi:hypothetical protein